MKRFFESREIRKLRRNKVAMVALTVCSVYGLVAAAVILGALSLHDTTMRVGTDNVPGFFRLKEPDKRLDDCDRLLTKLERAVKKPQKPGERAWKWAGRTLADRPVSELAEIVDAAYENYEEVADTEDEFEALSPEAQRVFIAGVENIEADIASCLAPLEGLASLRQGFHLFLGTDRQGRSIFIRALYSTRVAVQVGLVTALISVLFGTFLGVAAAFLGGWVDHVVIFLYSTMSSIPNLVLLTVLVFMFTGSRIAADYPLVPIYVAFCMTFWIGPCRVIRGETLKIKELEYVQAATGLGFKRLYIMIRHVLPNTAHLIFVNFSLLFVAAIKSEVILSFLGLGVKEGPSWGIMINQARPEVQNFFFWQIGTATVFMFGLVLTFNLLTDALQDAFDPKHAG